jgi:hypothetical protein
MNVFRDNIALCNICQCQLIFFFIYEFQPSTNIEGILVFLIQKNLINNSNNLGKQTGLLRSFKNNSDYIIYGGKQTGP